MSTKVADIEETPPAMLGDGNTDPLMRILHIIGTISPEAGGPTESVRVLLSYGPIGYTGEVVTLDDPDASFLTDFDFPIHALGPTRTVYGYNPKLLRWLRDNRHRFDGVVVNGLWQYCGYAAWRALRGHVPYVVFTHGMLDPYFKHTFPAKHLKKWLYWLMVEFWILRGAYRVLFTSKAEERLAKQSFWLHRWNGLVVPYGASGPPEEDPAFLKEAFFKQVPTARGKRFLLYLGRIHRKKGCNMLIDAFGKAAQTDPDLLLVMAGPDQQGWTSDLQAAAQQHGITDRVLWPGMLKRDVKWGAFFAAEAFVLPSHQENFGIAVAEALACSLPVLLADKVNIAEEIAEDGAALMEPDTPAGTLRLLERWIALSPSDRLRMHERALSCYRSHYDMRENAKTIIRLFKNASQHRRQHALEATLSGH